jgi:RNA recognition motif-containing protein
MASEAAANPLHPAVDRSRQPVRFADLSLYAASHVSARRSLFIGGIPADARIVTEEWLRGLCAPFGEIDAVQVSTPSWVFFFFLFFLLPSVSFSSGLGLTSLLPIQIGVDRETGHARGFAFVHFADAADCAEAIDNMHESEMLGRVVSVRYAENRGSAYSGLATGTIAGSVRRDGEDGDGDDDRPWKRAREMESVVQKNAAPVEVARGRHAPGQKPRNVAQLPPPPAACGKRCRGCGGFGVGLVSESDQLCNHCRRKGRGQ